MAEECGWDASRSEQGPGCLFKLRTKSQATEQKTKLFSAVTLLNLIFPMSSFAFSSRMKCIFVLCHKTLDFVKAIHFSMVICKVCTIPHTHTQSGGGVIASFRGRGEALSKGYLSRRGEEEAGRRGRSHPAEEGKLPQEQGQGPGLCQETLPPRSIFKGPLMDQMASSAHLKDNQDHLAPPPTSDLPETPNGQGPRKGPLVLPDPAKGRREGGFCLQVVLKRAGVFQAAGPWLLLPSWGHTLCLRGHKATLSSGRLHKAHSAEWRG